MFYYMKKKSFFYVNVIRPIAQDNDMLSVNNKIFILICGKMIYFNKRSIIPKNKSIPFHMIK